MNQKLLEPVIGDSTPHRVLFDYDPGEHWDLVILDRRSSGIEHVRRFSPTPVVGLDEAGASRPYLSYLIDTFPAYRQRHRANLCALSLLDLPEKGTDFHFPFRRVLIGLGTRLKSVKVVPLPTNVPRPRTHSCKHAFWATMHRSIKVDIKIAARKGRKQLSLITLSITCAPCCRFTLFPMTLFWIMTPGSTLPSGRQK